ncbi:hypothetical protein BBJ28_00015936, partial [Nothophytophthora sp. Chile5]
TLKRTGWVNNKVALPESVADHMYRMSMCCMLLDDNSAVNRSKCVEQRVLTIHLPLLHWRFTLILDILDRCVKMAIVHDLAESLVGDITPHDGRRVAEEDKHRMEKEALDEICSTLGDSASATEIRELWNEYEAGATEEAKMVKVRVLYKDIQTDRSGSSATAGTEWLLVLSIQDFDKFEMILQADDYERGECSSICHNAWRMLPD